jgi:hypothetical protein
MKARTDRFANEFRMREAKRIEENDDGRIDKQAAMAELKKATLCGHKRMSSS